MDHIPKTDKLFLLTDRAGWSIACTAFAGKDGLCWLVFGGSLVAESPSPHKWPVL
jgi:hypothetical protein